MMWTNYYFSSSWYKFANVQNSHNIKEFVLQQNKICRIDAVPFCNIFQDADCYGSIQPHPRHVIFQLNAKTVALP